MQNRSPDIADSQTVDSKTVHSQTVDSWITDFQFVYRQPVDFQIVASQPVDDLTGDSQVSGSPDPKLVARDL